MIPYSVVYKSKYQPLLFMNASGVPLQLADGFRTANLIFIAMTTIHVP